jgi:hypothetical protein
MKLREKPIAVRVVVDAHPDPAAWSAFLRDLIAEAREWKAKQQEKEKAA